MRVGGFDHPCWGQSSCFAAKRKCNWAGFSYIYAQAYQVLIIAVVHQAREWPESFEGDPATTP